MKVKDIKDTIEFLNKDGMNGLKERVMTFSDGCPGKFGLKKSDELTCTIGCFECWARCLELEENKDKLENEI